MGAGTFYPLLIDHADGRADHALASARFWAMSAGFVRGVGFVPRAAIWRRLYGASVLNSCSGFTILTHVPAKIAHEKNAHAQHEDDSAQAHQPDIGGKEIFECVHAMPLVVVSTVLGRCRGSPLLAVHQWRCG
jgi:hypothetical protein